MKKGFLWPVWRWCLLLGAVLMITACNGDSDATSSTAAPQASSDTPESGTPVPGESTTLNLNELLAPVVQASPQLQLLLQPVVGELNDVVGFLQGAASGDVSVESLQQFLPSDVGYAAVLAALVAADAYIQANTVPGSIERAEGYRYALRRIEMSQGGLTDDQSPHNPTIERCPSKICKLGFDSPDFTYVGLGPLDGSITYKVSGNRGTVHYIFSQVFTFLPTGFETGEIFDSDDLVTDANGDFEIYLAESNAGGWSNFIQIPANKTSRLVMRQAHYDWTSEVEASLAIEPLLAPAAREPSPAFTDERMGTAGFSLGVNHLLTFISFHRALMALEPNTMAPPREYDFGGLGGGYPGNHVSAMRYEIAADEAVIIEAENIASNFHNIQLGNIWAESLDYGSRVVSYNGFQAHVDGDNRIRYVIAQTDPGVANWLDAEDHWRGGAFIRWYNPETVPVPGLVVRVVPLAELRENLPADHPVVTPAERAEIRRERALAYNKRRNPAGIGVE